MRPKRQRGEGSSSSRSFDRRKFISIEAAEKFDNVLVGRPLVPERGLQPHLRDGDLLAMIYERGWGTLTAHPDPAVTAIVKEFYANAVDTPECEVMVRGHVVSFRREAINSFYNLRGFDDCPYAAFRPDYELIVRELCRPGTEWKRTQHDNRVKCFPFKGLSRYGKIWYAFLCAKLMPCTHVSDVNWERAGLLYAIITGIDIDIGGVIQSSIKRSLKGATSGGLPHPSLITALCQRAGVRWGANELLQSPTTLLDHKLIQRYHVWSGGVSHPRGYGFLPALPALDAQPAPAPAPVPPADASSSSTGLDRHFRRLHRRLDSIEDQNHRLAIRQGEMHAYNAQFDTALLAYFSRLHPGVDLGTFPAPPDLSAYPPPDSESEDADSADSDEEADNDDAAASDA